jgi:hypothetical protein
MSSKFSGPDGSTKPSRPSSSLSIVRELETLGLIAEKEELRFDRPSLRVPPTRVPRLPSVHSSNSSWRLPGVLGTHSRVESFKGVPSFGSSKSPSNSSVAMSFFCGVGGVMIEIGFEAFSLLRATLIVATFSPSPKKSSASLSRN